MLLGCEVTLSWTFKLASNLQGRRQSLLARKEGMSSQQYSGSRSPEEAVGRQQPESGILKMDRKGCLPQRAGGARNGYETPAPLGSFLEPERSLVVH